MSTYNQLDLQTLGSQPIMLKNLPDHWLSLRNNRLELATSGELPTILDESMQEYTSNKWKQNRQMSTYNWAGFRITRILTDYALKFPRHWF